MINVLKIGIILRKYKDFYKIDEDIINYIKKYNVLILGIMPDKVDNIKYIIDDIDGFIFQGGEIENEYDIDILKYLRDINKPTLGICLGMQQMSMISGNIEKIENDNHKSVMKYVHKINIISNTKLKDILKKDSILVNSKHRYKVLNTNLSISSLSEDNIIESVEDKSKTFFIGLQWHPEDIQDDINSKKIIEAFIDACKISN